tara:strand:- start:1197 stop:1346 length:150 start_codon:yes stop_codon:yes gene_type:complete
MTNKLLFIGLVLGPIIGYNLADETVREKVIMEKLVNCEVESRLINLIGG